MPTYVYECASCGKTFETEQRITEDPLKDCKCGATGSLKRLIQPVAVAFKGAGFHINDYAPSAASPRGKEETESGKHGDAPEGKKETESGKRGDAQEGKQETGTRKPGEAGSATSETTKVESK